MKKICPLCHHIRCLDRAFLPAKASASDLDLYKASDFGYIFENTIWMDSRVNTTTFAQDLEWILLNMPRTRRALDQLPDLTGVRLAACTHLDMKFIPAWQGLAERGASLYVTTCNTSTVRDEVVEYLQTYVDIEASLGMTEQARIQSLRNAIDWQPTHLCEMGADFSSLIYKEELNHDVLGSCEATSSGLVRLKHLPLQYPVFNWNDVPIKEHLHNRRMVGISTWHAFFERTHLTLHEKRVAVIGFGPVGQGVADSARAYGGEVFVVEKDKGRALEARYAGWEVYSLEDALRRADVVVTATGAPNIVSRGKLGLLKDGCFLINVGHLANEIDVPALLEHSHRTVRPFVEEVEVSGRRIYLFADGAMANLAAGFGDSVNAFDLTLAIMVAAIGFSISACDQFPNGVVLLPKAVWEKVLI